MTTPFTIKQAARLLPKRSKTANKTHGGKSLIVAGQSGMMGAGVLAAKAAARVGSGYVILATDPKFLNTVKFPDFLTVDYKKNISKLPCDAVGFGPGLGVGPRTKKLMQQAFKSEKGVLDADGLNQLAKSKMKVPSGWILTPHEGELARLLGTSSRQIKNHRSEFVKMAARKYGCLVLLKGHNTLVSDGKKVFQVQTGNVSLAKAGSGDVLTGMITGFLAQNLKSLDAALLGATVHGLAADFWLREKKDYLSLMASDIIEMLPTVLNKLRRK